MKLQYVVADEQIDDVLTKPLARVNFEYFREKLGVPRSRFPPNGSDESMILSNMVDVFIPWLDISGDPF